MLLIKRIKDIPHPSTIATDWYSS